MQERRKIAGKENKTNRAKKLRAIGLNENDSLLNAVRVFTPALDIIRTRPTDAAHSENISLIKHCQKILLVDAYIRPEVLTIIAASAPQFLDVGADHSFSMSDLIVKAFWNIALSNMQVCGRYPPKLSRTDFNSIVIRGRRSMQFLFHLGSGKNKTLSTTRAQPSRALRRSKLIFQCLISTELMSNHDIEQLDTISENMSQVSSVEEGTDFTAQSASKIDPERPRKGTKADTYENLKNLPNIHAGLHLWEVARTYGACRHIYTLLSEDKHREYKREIPKTNNQDIAATMIRRERLHKTINFGILGAYRETYPAVYEAFKQSALECKPLIRAFDRQDVIGSMKNGDYDADEFLDIREDEKHQRVSLSSEKERVCFNVGDFVVVRDGHIARLDGIFIHRLIPEDPGRVFLVVRYTSNKSSQRKDGILECPIYDLGDRWIVGLPALGSQKEWVIERKDGSVLHAR
ncbi:hypothetical protein IL306_002074, partial [Fusarium sp. DS 682]